MQPQPETPPTPPTVLPPNPGLPQNQPPKKSKLWLWITLSIVGVLAITGIVVAIVLVSSKSTPSKQDTDISRKESTKSKDSKDDKNSNDKNEKKELAKVNSKCLTSADFRKAGYGYMEDGHFILAKGKFSLNGIFFNPDATQYTYENAVGSEFAKLGELYKSNSHKEFSIDLVGQTHEASSTSEGSKLALERANKVKQDLIKQGIPGDKIIVSDPTVSNYGSNDNTADRNVRIYIVAPQECSEK